MLSKINLYLIESGTAIACHESEHQELNTKKKIYHEVDDYQKA